MAAKKRDDLNLFKPVNITRSIDELCEPTKGEL